jgi:hypothetical protein
MARAAAHLVTLIPAIPALLAGCGPAPRDIVAIRAYYDYDLATARQRFQEAASRADEQVLLNTLRLGLAELADGNAPGAEAALRRAFELLSTAGLNADRTTAAVFVHEGVRIWKGDPFEQALAYYWVAALYASLGDWENVRASAANALFRLTDFGADQNAESLARNAARDAQYLERGYRAVDSDFALGFLLEAIGSDLSGAAGMEAQLQAAVEINPRLESVSEVIRRRAYDTLLLVDYGKGPTKVAYGPDEALVKFVPQERCHGPLTIEVDGREILRAPAVCDVEEMAVDHRWNNLEDVRRAKSAIGRALLWGGAFTTGHGIVSDSGGTAAAGLALMLAGALLRAGAQGDTRYLELAPQSVYLVPLLMTGPGDLEVRVECDPGSRIVLADFEPGRPGSPRAVYLRLHGEDSPDPPWLTATQPVYGNDHAGVRPGDVPWILGGHDLSTPDRSALEAYQAGGWLADLVVADLEDLYRDEGIRIGAGIHVLDGGSALYTPIPYSIGYKRLMFSLREAYEPRSRPLRELARHMAAYPDLTDAQETHR